MRKASFFIIGILFVYTFCFAQNSSSSAPGIVMHREKAGNPQGWSEAKSSLGGFVVSLPSLFNDFSVTAPNDGGVVVTAHMVASLKDAPVKYAASCIQNPQGAALDNDGLKELVEKTRQVKTVSNERSVSYHDNPGIEFLVSDETGKGIVRAYIIGDKLYQLIVDFGSGSKDNVEENAQTFFNSFKVLQ